jgi:hypothetical protein
MLVLSYRQILTIITFSVLIYGIFSLQAFLSQNFIEHDTPLKNSINRALNGQIKY